MGVTVVRRGGGCDCGEERGWVQHVKVVFDCLYNNNYSFFDFVLLFHA